VQPVAFRSLSASGGAPGGTCAGADLNDADLLSAAQTDAGAFGLLYERYLGPVYRYCRVRLRHREAAEDATAEVFGKALAGLAGYRGGGVAAWLLRIAHNVVVDADRDRPTEPIEAAGDPPDAAPTPEEAVVARAERAALRAALAALPADQRAVLELQLAGWAGPQIADALGKTPAAVKMLRWRALNRLRVRSTTAAGWNTRERDDD
jgi:RNA polymerase sigma-70 factor (ECF subfamily)